MIIFPAIDIKDRTCVRLKQGDFNTVEKVAENPLETAKSFFTAGAEWIHMVDLDGAKDGKPVNTDIFTDISANSGLKVQVGGGIREMNTIESYLKGGVSRVILGSAAVNNPEFVREATEKYGERIAVGIDAKNRKVATEGWVNTHDIDYIDLAKIMEDMGVSTIIFTDISKDGLLSGPSLTQLDEISQAVSCDIIASGGVTSLKDIANLTNMNLYGAICGRALYSGHLDLASAIQLAGGGGVG